MAKFNVKITKKGTYKCDFKGNPMDLCEAIVHLMGEHEIIERLITTAAAAYAEVKLQELENKKDESN